MIESYDLLHFYVWSSLFFFSSRRRHTRYIGDWSSDVCSSDLDAQRMGRIQMRQQLIPHGNVGGIGLSRKIRAAEFVSQLFRGPIGKADVCAPELLVEDGYAEESRHLLFLNRVARGCERAPAAAENHAGDAPIHGRQKSERSLLESKLHIGAEQLDLLHGVHGGRIHADSIQRIVKLVRRYGWCL